MGNDKKAEREKAMREYRRARRALAACPDRTETDRYLRLNRAVIAAEKKIPWWRR